VTALAVAVAGALGVLARLGLQRAWPRGDGLPYATATVNLTGAFLAGLAAGILSRRESPPWLSDAVLVGFLGGYTTFSAFCLETTALLERGRTGLALAYALGSVVAGVLATFGGLLLSRVLR
jgi:CrcB protein